MKTDRGVDRGSCVNVGDMTGGRGGGGSAGREGLGLELWMLKFNRATWKLL